MIMLTFLIWPILLLLGVNLVFSDAIALWPYAGIAGLGSLLRWFWVVAIAGFVLWSFGEE